MVVRIGTRNLENLFKPLNPFAPKTEEEYQAKLDALARAVARQDRPTLVCPRLSADMKNCPWADMEVPVNGQ
jgi:hypothetical protein